MPFNHVDRLSYFTFDIFDSFPIQQAVFTRRGGVSSNPWDYLNVGSTVGDNQANVNENRRRSFEAAGRDSESMFDSWLEHGTQVLIADKPAPPSIDSPRKGDIIITDSPDVTLFMRYADCVPIMLFDRKIKAIALVHAGWVGTIRRAAAVAVDALSAHYGSSPADLIAAIGPSIASHHYEVSQDVADQVQEEFGDESADFLLQQNGSIHFDLWAANQAILKNAGVGQIDNPKICTACHLDDWFSHRAEKGRTGRFGALIGLSKN